MLFVPQRVKYQYRFLGIITLVLTIILSMVLFLSRWLLEVMKSYNIAFISAFVICSSGFVALVLAKPENPQV